MPSKHPNDEVIRAWLEGKTVQYQWQGGSDWEDHNMSDYGTPNILDQEDEGTWRIKPELKIVWAVYMDKTNRPAASFESREDAERFVKIRNENCTVVFRVVKLQEVEK